MQVFPISQMFSFVRFPDGQIFWHARVPCMAGYSVCPGTLYMAGYPVYQGTLYMTEYSVWAGTLYGLVAIVSSIVIYSAARCP